MRNTMKKLLLFTMLLASFMAGGQSYLRPNTSYGLQLYRIAPDSVLHTPKLNDTLLHTVYTVLPQLRAIGDSLWFYNGTFWRNMSRVASAGTATWGAIGGVLSDQTDLQAALNALVPNARSLTINGTTFDLSANRTWTVGGVTDVAASDLFPLYTTSVTGTTTKTLTFNQSNAGAYTVFGNNTGSSAVPNFFSPVLASALYQNQGTATTVLHGNPAGNPSWGAVNLATDVSGNLPPANLNSGLNADASSYWSGDGTWKTISNVLVDGIVSGGIVTWTGTGLVFNVSRTVYNINNVQYIYPGGTVTLATADPSNPRQDAIVVTNTNTATNISGTAQANPEVPSTDLATQVFLTSVFVDAGATTPTQIGQVIIRDVNYAAGEWWLSRTATVDSLYGPNPYHLTNSVRLTAATNGQYFQYNSRAGALFNKSSYNAILLYIRNGAILNAARGLNISLFNGATQVGVAVTLVTYGYVKNVSGAPYMVVAVPMSAFTGPDQFNAIRITNTGTGGTLDVQFDYVQLQSGISSGPAAPVKQIFFASVASMKAYAGTVDIAAVTQGYYTANDGGTGQYRYSVSSTATDDGFLVHKPDNIPTTSPGRWLLQFGSSVNILQAGADPTGIADARPAFKKCLTAVTTISQGPLSLNGTIEIPRGTFRMSDSVQIRNVVNIIGLGAGVYPNMESYLLFDNLKGGLYFLEASSGRSGKGCVIKNLFLRCVGTDWRSNRHGIFSNTQLFVDNVGVYNFSGDGFTFDTRDSGNANGSMLVNCHADYNRRYGFSSFGNDANNIHYYACDANTNGGSNFHDQSFLGNQYYGLHSSFAGIRQPDNNSYVNVAGTIYGCIQANSAIQPGVTTGWQNYWVQQNNLPLGWTTTWSVDSAYVDACAFTSTGVSAATNVYGGYTESGQAFSRLVGSAMWWGGVAGAGYTANSSILLGNQNMLGGEVRVYNKFEPNAYTSLDESFGVNIGLVDIGTGAGGILEFRAYGADTTVRMYANALATPNVFYPIKHFKGHTDFGRDTVIAGSMILNSAVSPLYFTDLNDPAYNSSKKRGLYMGSASPTTGLEKEYAAGDIILNNNASTDTIGWKCIIGGRPGTWSAWVLGTGGGGGGGSAAGATGNIQFKGVLGGFEATSNLSYDSSTRKLTVKAAGLDPGIVLQSYTSDNYSPKITFNTTTFNIPASIWADYNGDLLVKTEFGQFTKFGTSATAYNVSINSYTTGSLSSPDNYSLLTRSASATTIAAIARGTTSQTASIQEWQDVSNNVLGAVSAGGSLDLFNGTAPTTSVTNGIRLYSEDVAASAELKVRDEAGNITTLSPHNVTGIPYKLKPLGWTYHSEKDGQYITVDELKLAEEVERLTREVEELKALLIKDYKAKEGTRLIYKGAVRKNLKKAKPKK